MPSKIPAEERLTNLVVALMATELGLTRKQILGTVSGYRQRAEQGADRLALEKMFDRDKEDLRHLGIPLEIIGDPSDPNDLREARYRIPLTEYELPEEISFTPAEAAILALAANVWRESSLSSDAQSALRKIRALGIDVDEPILGFAPRIEQGGPAFAPLQEAVDDGVVVRFRYLRPGESSPRERRVHPLALVEAESRWHLFGRDLDLDAERTFLLRRIVGEVRLTGERVDPAAAEGAGERALGELRRLAARNVALLDVAPGTEAELRLARRGTHGERGWEIPYLDLHVLADELASYGPEVRVEDPPALRDEVVSRLRRVRDLHEGAVV